MKRTNTERLKVENKHGEHEWLVTYSFERTDDEANGLWDVEILSCDVDVLGTQIDILPTLSEEENDAIIQQLEFS